MQVSGLDFTFQTAAPKHFSHNNWKKAAAPDLYRCFFPLRHLQQPLGLQYCGFDTAPGEASGVLPAGAEGQPAMFIQMILQTSK